MSEHALGFFSPWAICALVLVLQILMPARWVTGYAQYEISQKALRYRLNGLPVFVAIVAGWFALGYTGLVPFEWLWRHRWSSVSGACVLGLVASAAALRGVPARSTSRLRDYFLGRMENPRLFDGQVDTKMYLYLAGATVLKLNLLAFTAHHVLSNPISPSPGVIVHLCLFSWFLLDYLIFEPVHLYTYDLVAERVGFKLVWGCLVFYPYFYAIGLWAVADLANPKSPTWFLVLSVAVFLAGWILARGANMQKYYFKQDPGHVFLGLIKSRSMSDGERHLLCNGFWGISRHVNYLGEVLMGIGLTLALGWPSVIVPWLYPLYYVVFLAARERDDDRRCEEKYGELWQRYRKAVPWRIVPYLY